MTRGRGREGCGVCAAAGGDSDGVMRPPAGACPSERAPEGTFFNLVVVDGGKKWCWWHLPPPAAVFAHYADVVHDKGCVVRKIGLHRPVGAVTLSTQLMCSEIF